MSWSIEIFTYVAMLSKCILSEYHELTYSVQINSVNYHGIIIGHTSELFGVIDHSQNYNKNQEAYEFNDVDDSASLYGLYNRPC